MLRKDSAGLLAGRILAAALGLLVPLLMAGWLSHADYGRLTLVFVIATGGAAAFDFGITPANTYLIAREKNRGRSALAFSLFYALAALIVCQAVYLFVPSRTVITNALGGVPAAVVLSGLLATPLLLLVRFHGGSLLGLGSIWGFNAIHLQRWGWTLVFSVLLFLVLEATFQQAAVAWLLALALTVILTTSYLYSKTSARKPNSNGYARSAFRYGRAAYLGIIGSFVMYRIDHLLLNYFHGEESVATYNIASLGAETLMFLPSAVGLALFPRSASMDRDTATGHAVRASRVILWYALAAAPLLYIGMQLVTELLLWVGKPQYRASLLPFLILIPGLIAYAVDHILSSYFMGRKLQHYDSGCVLLMVALNTLLNFLAIPKYGILGAALATSIAYLVGFFVSLFLFSRYSGMPWTEIFRLKPKELFALWQSKEDKQD